MTDVLTQVAADLRAMAANDPERLAEVRSLYDDLRMRERGQQAARGTPASGRMEPRSALVAACRDQARALGVQGALPPSL